MAFLPCHLLCTFRFSGAGLSQVTWSQWRFVGASSTRRQVVEWKRLVLKASEFQHLFEEGPTEKVYANTPLAGLGHNQQGRMCQEWARKMLQKKNPEAEILDPERGTCCNGSRRATHQAESDFLMDGRRVEIKSARMAWTSTPGCWHLQFFRIKLPYGERTQPAL